MQKLILTSIIILFSQLALGFDTEAKYAFLMDYDTQTILFEKEANTQMAPSSMSKMMTAYIAFEYLKSGQMKMNEQFPISEKAWKMGGTRMFIPLDAIVSFEDLLKGLIIDSGNDAAVAIAEILAGSEEEFAHKMNDAAQKLGMNNTHFTNATGWPEENNYSCAHDLAILAYHTIKDFPEYYHYYGQIEFIFNDIKQGNRNGLLYRNIGADGLKTGHADDAGYGLTASVKRNGRRLIAVVNGLKSNKDRTIQAEMLVNYGMSNFTNIKLAEKDQMLAKIPVSNGKQKEIELIVPEAIIFTVSKSEVRNIKTKLHYFAPAVAPIAAGTHLGDLLVEGPVLGNKSYPLVAKNSVEKANFIYRIQANLINLFN
jgi:D-alanyl-D-alanine carboxypeptidase (penicillin-binding protein 5/6)